MDFNKSFSRHIVAPIYAIKEKSSLFKHLNELERTQWLPIEELQKCQLIKLKNVLIHAYETVGFYRERFQKAGFDPYRFCYIEQLQTIPFLTKKDIIENTDRLISQKYQVGNLIPSCTGGSTGTQLHFYIDRESVNEKNACAWRHNRWANWDLGMPVASLWGNPPKATTFKAKIRSKFLTRFFYLDTINMTASTMGDFTKKVNQFDNYILYGHSTSQYLLAKFLKDNNIPIQRASGIVSTSMMLMENERSIIEKVFNRKVTNRYGCEEVSLIGCECEKHNGMHLNIDHLVVEFIKSDGGNAKAGEEGRIVVTDLTNYGMPFIRYEVGDVGVLSNRICKCGRSLPLMEKVVGRTADFLYREDGSQVAGVSLIERWLTNIPGVQQMQIVQNKIDCLIIKIVRDEKFSEDKIKKSLHKEFKKVFQNSTMVVKYCDKISQENSGKYRFAICNIEQFEKGKA